MRGNCLPRFSGQVQSERVPSQVLPHFGRFRTSSGAISETFRGHDQHIDQSSVAQQSSRYRGRMFAAGPRQQERRIPPDALPEDIYHAIFGVERTRTGS